MQSVEKGGYFNSNEVSLDNWHDWRWQVENSPDCCDLLRGAGCFDRAALTDLNNVAECYPFRVTPYYCSLIDWNNPCDPVRIQCVPDTKELDVNDAGSCDPFLEMERMPVPGLIHRFKDRVLVVALNRCAVYCRHCTRKNTLNKLTGNHSKSYFEPMIEYVKGRTEVREVIISGGDPLLMDVSLLDWLLNVFHEVKHVEVLRLGTRVPVVLPMRVDEELCGMLAKHRPIWVNTQFNHPVEITDEAVKACDLMLRHGIPVSNQAVLLRGVNDSIETMSRLCNMLQKHMIRPYYVFQCDPVKGVGYLRTPLALGAEIEEAMRTMVGGLSLPRFVADIPGEQGKVMLSVIDSGDQMRLT